MRGCHAVLAVALLAGACESGPPPAEPTPAVVAPAAPRPAPRAATPPAPIDLAWHFASADGLCTASAAGPGAQMTLRVTQTAVEIAATAPGRPPRPGAALGFTGTLASWTLAGRSNGPRMAWSEPLTDEAAGRVVALLSGGLVTVPAEPAASLRLPPAGPAGQAWFGCVRTLLLI